MSRTHAKHLEPKKFRTRAPKVDDYKVKRVTKSHKQRRANERTKLRKEYL